ncbi:MAG: ATPase, T2SS/T4P/T4SS family [Pseudomonadota bacterium]
MNMDSASNKTAQEIVTPIQLEAALQIQKTKPQLKLGSALLQENIITVRQLNAALQKQTQVHNLPLGKILVDMGAVTEETIIQVLAKKYGIPGLNLRKFHVDSNAINAIPSALVHKHRAVPLYRIDSHMVIAMEDPLARESLQDLELCVQLTINPVLASREDLEFLMEHFYDIHHEPQEKHHHQASQNNTNHYQTKSTKADETIATVDTDEAIEPVKKIIVDALNQGASEIHIESMKDTKPSKVRFRKDGAMMLYSEIQADLRDAFISRIKTMSGLDTSEKHHSQNGKIAFEQAGQTHIELCVTTIPTVENLEDVVVRILSAPKIIPLDNLGLAPPVLGQCKNLVVKPQGVILVCGPAGSGKTTTLHSMLECVNTPDRKIWTIEDRIDITQDGLRQIQIAPKNDWTFATALRSVLNAGPDVIMVGETNDQETAKTVIEASLTGHLVLSTMRTSNLVESLARLLDYGVDPFNFADALLAIINQRVVRRLCTNCRKPRVASREDLETLAQQYCANTTLNPADVAARWLQQYANPDGSPTLYSANGCEKCGHTGYKGRIGVYELLVVSNTMKSQVQAWTNAQKILNIAVTEGMQTLKQDGIEKILQGHTDWDAVRAICA